MPKGDARRVSALRGAAILTFLAASLLAVVAGRGERSGYISMGQPGAWDFSESLLGYCFLHGPRPFMKECIPHVTQVGWFNGSQEAMGLCEFPQEFRYLRGLYSFLASLLAPPLDVISALLAVNWLCWALCAWSAWRLTRDAFHSEAAGALAAILTAGGIGMTAHIHDYSPHLLAFATYYFGVWLLYRSGVWRRRRPWRTHLRLGVYLAVACLAYNTGVMLLGAYLWAAARRNRILPMLAATALALSARPLWQATLNLPLEDLEADYLVRSVERWRALADGEPYYLVRTPLRWLVECLLFFDSPLVVLLGMGCCLFTPMSPAKRWFGLATVATPVLAAWLFAPMASARGYIVYGATIWIYACLAYQATRFWAASKKSSRHTPSAVRRLSPFAPRKSRYVRRAKGDYDGARWAPATMTAAVVLVLVTHYLWSEAHLARNLGPVKTYFLGLDEGRVYFLPMTAVSLTGREPTPVLFGGGVSLTEAGAYVAPEQHRLDPDRVLFRAALLNGGFFYIYLGWLAGAAARTPRQAAGWLAGWTCLYALSCGWDAVAFRTLPAFFPVSRAVVLQPGERIRLEIDLSPAFAKALATRVRQDDAVVLYTLYRQQEGLEIAFFAGENRLSLAPRQFDSFQLTADEQAGYRALIRSRRLVMEAVNRSPAPRELAAWQRAGLPGRRCVRFDENGAIIDRPPVTPICEVRVFSVGGRLQLAGF